MHQAIQMIPATATQSVAIPTQAHSDAELLLRWLHGRPLTTQAVYRSDVGRFMTFAGCGLREVTLGDLQDFADSLGHLAPATRARMLSSIKSCFAFGHGLGYLPFDIGRALRLPTLRNRLSERIIDKDAVKRLRAAETKPRNQVILDLLYSAGLRVSELCGLTWGDTQERGDSGQLAVFGKGSKTRVILLSAEMWRRLCAIRGEAIDEAPVFPSQKGGALTSRQVERIVRAAAERAGIDAPVSPHTYRHAHASHALDAGVPLHVLQATLGHASIATTGRYLHARPTDGSSRYVEL